jgi:hypothetical protein
VSDLFWDVATSYTALCFVAAVLLAALVVGYFPLLEYFPVIGPYVPVARLVAILAFGLLGFLVGFRISDEREAMKNLKSEVEAKTIDLNATVEAEDQANAARTELAKQAIADQERIAGYEEAIKKRPVGDCVLTDDDRKWMRKPPAASRR